MLKGNLLKALSEQFNLELKSAYLYLAMSSVADRMGYKGFANWLNIQEQEERAHAMHMYEFILDRGCVPVFTDINVMEHDYKNLAKTYEKILAHEQHVTDQINKIATLALKENDHSTYMFIQWYVNEQVEEEANVDLILQKLTRISDNDALLYALDTELAARVFVDPFPKAGA